jgi:TRAP-type C4-dicarboxylate transport system permease small subunit
MFGLPCVYAIWYLADRGHVWTFMGFPTYGEGPFEDIGIETTVLLLGAFLLVCAEELVAGWMLWQRRRAGVMLALALLPLEFAFWIGFALPLGPVLAVARTAVIIMAWPRARGAAATATPDRSRRT